MKMKVRGWWDRCLCSQLWSFIRLSKYVEITIYQTWQSQAGTVTLRQNSITTLPVSHMMWCDVMCRDTFNEMRERREISLKVSGCNDETKEAGGPSRCQPTHRSCPLLSPGMAEVPGLYCIVVWWELCSLLCLFAVMTSTGVTVRLGRPGEFLPCWSLLALSSLTR